MNIERTKRLMKGHEALRLRVYQDSVGVATIGYGRNLSGRGVSVLEAEQMFDRDFEEAVSDAAAVVGETWVGLDEVRRAVLVDLAFNLGRARLARFERTLDAVRQGEYGGAATELLDSNWANQVRSRATKLSEMMRSGEWL